MRRFVTSVVLFLFAIPFGVSLSGCKHALAPTYCNGGDSGVVAGQATTLTLQPIVTGISLNFAEIGAVSAPSAADCKGASVSVGNFTYGTTNMAIADIQPSTGRLCGGTWNRNSGGGIADFTYCIPTNQSGTAFISASADGVTSNSLPVFVHPIVTSILLGGAANSCGTSDPTTGCCPYFNQITTTTTYNPNSCVSQGQTAQLVARVYAGTGANQTNISCQVGPLQYSAASSSNGATLSSGSIVSIDPNGVATAEQPGSVLINANTSNASSSAGYFSTCPPASITLTTPGVTGNPVTVQENTPQPVTTSIVDTKGNAITGLDLEYVSTTPATIPGAIPLDPTLAGAASITAICQPPNCNPSSYNQIGLLGNGKPVVSNTINVTTPGTNGTVLYMASTQSDYIVARDFTQTAQTQPLLLPYQPNSMVLTTDGTTLYVGSSTALMVLNVTNNLTLNRTDLTSPGSVLAISPDSTMIVITDPTRQITTIESSTGSVVSTYNGVGTHAEFAPDSQTVYITAGNALLVYSTDTGWTSISPATPGGTPVLDVAVTVPSVGAYLAGPVTSAVGYCEVSTPSATPGVENNIFYPPADSSAAITDRIAATNDGLHILGATVSPTPTLSDLHVEIPAGNTAGTSISIACPANGGALTFSNSLSSLPIPGITASAIDGVVPTSDSSLAFITYTGSGGILPAYAPAPGGAGTLTPVHLSGNATAPLAATISSDNTTIYVGTSGDNLVHVITRSPLTDSSTLVPGLTNPSGAAVPVNLIAQKPRKTT